MPKMLNLINKGVECTVETQNIVEAFTYEKTVVLWKSCCFQLWKAHFNMRCDHSLESTLDRRWPLSCLRIFSDDRIFGPAC
jgi:hypothetical protein